MDTRLPKRNRMRIFLFVLLIILLNLSLTWAATFSQQSVSYHQQAEDALKQGDIDCAITYYQKIIALNSNDTVAHNILGVLYEGKNQLERAETEYLKTLSLEPKYLDAHINLARLYEKTNRTKEAVKHLENIIVLANPKDKRVPLAKSKIIEFTTPQERKDNIIRNIEKEQANKLIEGIIRDKRLIKEENKKKSQAHLSTGKKYYKRKEYSAALEEFKAALRYDQKNSNAANYIELCQEKINQAKLKTQGDKGDKEKK